MSDGAIVSGGIRGTKARVRREGQLETFSVSVEEFENVSARNRNSFAWSIVPANFAVTETLLLLQNTSSALTLHIIDIDYLNDLDSQVEIHIIDAAITPSGGTEVTGFCYNRTAPRVADAVAFSNETGNSSQGTILWEHEILADTPRLIDFFGALILPKGAAVGVDVVAGATALASLTIRGFYAIPDEDRT